MMENDYKENEMTEDENSFYEDDLNPWGLEIDQYCTFMHLSQFAGYIVPFAGFIMPIVMWTQFKNESELIDTHGRNIINWIISSVIYFIGCFVLMFVLIGIPLAIALAIASIIFTILGAVRAGDGEVYKYPMTINFI